MARRASIDDGLGCRARDVVILDIGKFVGSRVLSRDEKLERLDDEIKASRNAGAKDAGAVSGAAAGRLVALLRAEKALQAR